MLFVSGVPLMAVGVGVGLFGSVGGGAAVEVGGGSVGGLLCASSVARCEIPCSTAISKSVVALMISAAISSGRVLASAPLPAKCMGERLNAQMTVGVCMDIREGLSDSLCCRAVEY